MDVMLLGMLSMSLVPWFSRDVSDVTVVPINISYDRLMEQSLFAYEHLGVPKPKESTGVSILILFPAPLTTEEVWAGDLVWKKQDLF